MTTSSTGSARLRTLAAWLTASAPAAGLAALALLALAGLGTRWDWWHFSFGFKVLRAGAILGAAAAVLGLWALASSAWRRRWLGAAFAAGGLLMGLVALGLLLNQLRLARLAPAIHDVSTDLEAPPPFVAVAARRAGAPNPAEYDGPAVAEKQRLAYPDLLPARFAAAPAAVFTAAEGVARALGWEIVAAVPEEGRLEATATTFWFGFKDDVVVRLRAEEGGTRVDVRSKSRVGRSDLGGNARRIRDFLARLGAAGLPAAP